MTARAAGDVRSPAGALVILAIAVAACSAPASGSAGQSAPGTATVGPKAANAYITREQGPPPGPEKPFRGVMREQIRVVDGYISMYFELDNTGQEPVTFLNTLYDYEPDQLYTPAVRLEWQDGGNAVYTRTGRFFPSPATLQPGEAGIYLMGGQPLQGSGTFGGLVSHIKYCPTRGMDDTPSQPVSVSDLSWSSTGGTTTVSGTLTQESGPARPAAPTVGVAFFNAAGEFVGAVVQASVGGELSPGAATPFEVRGRGVLSDEIASARAFAWTG